MKSRFLASASFLVLAGAASAADLPSRQAPVVKAPIMAPAWTWAGPYVGLNVGAAWHRADSNYTDTDAPPNTFPSSGSRTGATFGGQVGYNWQTQNWVVGVEADVNWLGVDISRSDHSPYVAPITVSNKIPWMATFRGRVGIAVLNNTLLYATGGAALAEINSSLNISGACPCFTSNSTRWGWVAGGGIEYRFAQNWTARVEALYSDFGTKSVAESSGGFVGYVGKFKNTVTQARVGLNYKW